MEIGTFLRLSRRRIAVLLVASVLSGIAAGAATALRGTSYRAEAVVFTAQVFSSDSSNVNERVSDLQTALSLPSVLSEAADASGGDPSAIASRLQYEQEPNGLSVRLSYTDADAELAQRVVEQVVLAGIGLLIDQEVEAAQRTESQANDDLDSAVQDLGQFQQSSGAADVVGEVERRSTDILALRNEIALGATPALSALLTQKEAELQALVAEYATYQRLNTEYDRASEDLQAAQRSVNTAESQRGALQSPLVVVTPPAAGLGLVRTVAPQALAAAVLCVVIGLGLFVLLDRRPEGDAEGGEGRPLGRRPAAGGSDPDPDPDPNPEPSWVPQWRDR